LPFETAGLLEGRFGFQARSRFKMVLALHLVEIAAELRGRLPSSAVLSQVQL